MNVGSGAALRPQTRHGQLEQGFPKVMRHPHHQPAVISNSRNPNTPIHGKAEMFPAVTVTTQDQQEYYESRGYVAQG